MTLELPCYVGDTVFAYMPDALCVIQRHKCGKRKHAIMNCLVECVISEIEICYYSKEPLFTAISREYAEFERFWLSEFGKTIFTPEQYYKHVK